jgi:hypothetical protein
MWGNLKDQARHLGTVPSFIYRFGALGTSCGREVVKLLSACPSCPSGADPGVFRIDSCI